MVQAAQPRDLEEVLDLLQSVEGDGSRISLGDVMEVVGRRSFGPVLLVAGLITSAPIIGDIPGVPSLMGTMVIVVAAQLLLRRRCVWLPEWLLRRSASKQKLDKGLTKLRRPARFVDRYLHRRLEIFTDPPLAQIITFVCLLISAATPLMELVPFSANVAGAALLAFGLALIAHDGLFAIIAFLFTAATATFLMMALL